ncbi:MAG: hypothetical protein P8H05_01485 [Schleiferiaceae bacterium]|nr:hypothetical protein [Schleiferiaceae bacterium]
MKEKKIIDVCGYGHSGKGVLTDFFREFEGVTTHQHLFEFNLLRIQGGLLDLKHSIVDRWSPIRSSAALTRFETLIKRLGTNSKATKPGSWFTSTGNNYNSFFDNKFIELSEEYINQLIVFKTKKVWSFTKVEESGLKTFSNRLQNQLFPDRLEKSNFYLIDNKKFFDLTRAYLDELLSLSDGSGNPTIVTNNMIEPYNPDDSIKLFNDARSIIIQRDPRDIYASLYVDPSLGYTPGYLKKSSIWKEKCSFLLADNITAFIEQQRISVDNINSEDDSDKVLRLRVEDVILNYPDTQKLLYEFTGLSSAQHTKSQEFFKPNESVKNIGLWKKLGEDSNVKRIEDELADLCYQI